MITSLLRQRRFLAFFVVQFIGAFNDNLYKSALLVLFALSIHDPTTLSFYTNLSMALFILPMFICSAWSGLLAEKFEKRTIIIVLKWFEVLIMLLGIIAFWGQQPLWMIAILFLLGLQSSFFGPVKYGLLPERLSDNELMAGNGLVEAGTFLAILFGTILGAYLIAQETLRTFFYVLMVCSACLGLGCAYAIPSIETKKMAIKFKHLPAFHPWRQTRVLLQYSYQQKEIFAAILGISWFWVIGGLLLTQLPQFAQTVLRGDEGVMTYLLALFSVGVGVGSLASNALSKGRIEIGLVPVGALLMSLALYSITTIAGRELQTLQTLSAFIHDERFWHTTLAFAALAFAGGLYIVPLYALIQHHAREGYKSQMIAANNIINSFFMVLTSVLAIVILSGFEASLQQFFTLLLVMQILITAYSLYKIPRFILYLLAKLIAFLGYRVKISGQEHIPKQGAAILICNHLSYMDAIILLASIRRPVRFVMYYKIFDLAGLNWVFRGVHAIAIAGRKEQPQVFRQALKSVDDALINGELVMIFPEGKISQDGEIDVFKRGVELMLRKRPVPIIPMALDNLWGSFYSHKNGLFKGWPRHYRPKVFLTIGAALAPDTKVEHMQAVVQQLKNQTSAKNEKTPF